MSKKSRVAAATFGSEGEGSMGGFVVVAIVVLSLYPLAGFCCACGLSWFGLGRRGGEVDCGLDEVEAGWM